MTFYDDGTTVQLLADPRRIAGAARLAGGAALVTGIVGLLCLLNLLLALLAPGLLVRLGWTTARSTDDSFWLWPGFTFCTLVFGGLAIFFGLAWRRVRGLAAQRFLLMVDPGGLTSADFATLPWSAISQVSVEWRPMRQRRGVTVGAQLGAQVGRRLITGAGQDGMSASSRSRSGTGLRSRPRRLP